MSGAWGEWEELTEKVATRQSRRGILLEQLGPDCGVVEAHASFNALKP
jgi:hypothetical protein